MYCQLTHEEYKSFEDQLRRYRELETTHTTTDERYYHKSFRLFIGNVLLEVHGPIVAPNPEGAVVGTVEGPRSDG
jgi:hypothetical protein